MDRRAPSPVRGAAAGRRRPASAAAALDGLLAEDRATFGGTRGDASRWVRQVLDGKMIFVPADGGEPRRVWSRVIEYFTLDATGTTMADFHTWNLRWMLTNAYPGDDPRERIDSYQAWKAMARGRLTVGKLFTATQQEDAGRQFDSGRRNEYELWTGRLRAGFRGPLGRDETPSEGWARFFLRQDDEHLVQHAERNDLRFVPDPNYVDGLYEYVARAPDNDAGWVHGRELPDLPLRDEPFDFDPLEVPR